MSMEVFDWLENLNIEFLKESLFYKKDSLEFKLINNFKLK